VIVAEHGGEFPRSSEALAALPGIGRSTAAAIAAFSFGERVAILDGNVKRVLARVLAFAGDLAEAGAERELWGRRPPLAGPRHRGLHPGPDGPRGDDLRRPRTALPALPGA
jgi:A/G-specific adenine glycosylase